MPKKKSGNVENWFVCYECNEWHSEKSPDELKHCPNCGNKLTEVCGKCKKPIEICFCKKGG